MEKSMTLASSHYGTRAIENIMKAMFDLGFDSEQIIDIQASVTYKRPTGASAQEESATEY